ncbi:MAG: histidinol-phosphate transaminase [Gammaproteobacteria bacterium]|nr:histidinol-phosphate transaminase [Gammaproteobacteria bacterium]
MPAEDRIRRWVRASVRAASVYPVGKAPGLIKLDAMENPYPWPEPMREAWLRRLRNVALNRYPDAEAAGLKGQLRAVFSLPGSAGILLGNGSDEIIQIIACALSGPGASLLAPEPSFAMYESIAKGTDLNYVGVPLQAPDFSLDVDAMLAAVERVQPAVVFIAWPNNPTGNLFDRNAVECIARSTPGIVVVDEAYHAFAGATLMPLLEQYDNVLVMRTLSKLGLAGLRLGFLAGPPAWLLEFEKLRLPYNVGVLVQESAGFFLEHIDVLQEQTRRLCADRERLYQALLKQPGVTVWPSAGNFLLFRTDTMPASEVHERLKRAGLLVRCVADMHPLLAGCLRVTVGTAGENDAFLTALSEVLARH